MGIWGEGSEWEGRRGWRYGMGRARERGEKYRDGFAGGAKRAHSAGTLR